MKFSTLLILLLAGAGIFYVYKVTSVKFPAALAQIFRADPEPRLALMKMAEQFPRIAQPGQPVTEVASYLEKSDDPLFPVVGYITFRCGFTYEYVFNWAGDRWLFSRMLCRNDGRDVTKAPDGIEIMSSPEMQRFLESYKISATAAAPRADFRAPAAGPRRTPTPQETALDVSRKYGGTK